jgi:glycosyltransferase involved in cell wall biosynthesis
MKIAFVSVFDPTNPHTWSGTPYAILAQMIRAGVGVDVIGPLSRKARYQFLPTWVASKVLGKTYHADREPRLIAAYSREIERRMSGRRYDAIFSLETFLVARLNRPEPIIYWSDAVWNLMKDYYYYNAIESMHAKATLYEQQAMNKAAHAIYSSDWAAAGAHKYYQIDRAKLSVIPFGANLEIEHDHADIEAAVAARRNDICTLLFLGVDWKRKGGDIAIETAGILNEWGLETQLLVVGCKIPGKRPSFAKELGFISKRTKEGQSRIAELLRTSSFLIFPTRAECSAIVLSEASAFGLPIITTDTGGIPTYVRQGINGIRVPLSEGPRTYAEHIYRIFHDRDSYRMMALAGWTEYKQRLNWSNSVQSLLSLLK